MKNQLNQNDPPAQTRKRRRPRVDIYETASVVTILADMPGTDESAVEALVEDDVLTLRGKPAPVDRAGRVSEWSEFEVVDYERSFTLSERIDRNAITASLKNGVLEVKLGKLEPESRRIDIETK